MRSRLEYIYGIILLIIFGGIVLHAPLSVMLSTIFPADILLIKSWKEILLVLLLPMAAVIVVKRGLFKDVLGDWVIRLILLYVTLHVLVAFAIGGGITAIAAGFAIDIRYLLFFVLVYILIKVSPNMRQMAVKIGVIGASVVVVFATMQVFLPYDILANIGYDKHTIIPYLLVDQNFDFIRVNSTLRGPNPLGAYTVIVLAVLVSAILAFWKKMDEKHLLIPVGLLTLCSSVALWVSYSRSALVAAIIAVCIVILSVQSRRVLRRISIVAAVGVIVVAGLFVTVGVDNELVSNVILHKNPDSSALTGSNEGHADSIEVGVNRLINQPFGGGVGSTGSASLYSDEPIIIENQYLFVAHESGWIGLGIFVAIFILILVRLWKRRRDWLSLGLFASGIGLGLVGLLLPVWVDDTVSIIWWGFAAVALATSLPKNTKKLKNTTN